MGSPPNINGGATKGARKRNKATSPEAAALPSEPADANTLMGRDNWSLGNTLPIMLLAAGPSEASPMVRNRRAMHSVQKPTARPMPAVIRLQTIRLTMISHLRLNWSATRASGRPASA